MSRKPVIDFVCPHAVERYRVHHPEAEEEDIHQALHWGTDISPEFVQILAQRHLSDPTSRYILSPDKQGIFIISKDTNTVITYLRLSGFQQKFVQDGDPYRKKSRSVSQRPDHNATYFAELEARYKPTIPPPMESEPKDSKVAVTRREAFEASLLARYGFTAGSESSQ